MVQHEKGIDVVDTIAGEFLEGKVAEGTLGGLTKRDWNRGEHHRWSVWKGAEGVEVIHGLRTTLRHWLMEKHRRPVWGGCRLENMQLSYFPMPLIPQHVEVLKIVHTYERRYGRGEKKSKDAEREDAVRVDIWEGDMELEEAEWQSSVAIPGRVGRFKYMFGLLPDQYVRESRNDTLQYPEGGGRDKCWLCSCVGLGNSNQHSLLYCTSAVVVQARREWAQRIVDHIGSMSLLGLAGQTEVKKLFQLDENGRALPVESTMESMQSLQTAWEDKTPIPWRQVVQATNVYDAWRGVFSRLWVEWWCVAERAQPHPMPDVLRAIAGLVWAIRRNYVIVWWVYTRAVA